ncbi:hypothetical protein OY671_011489, partial [Metschnikowia pulcherrima]
GEDASAQAASFDPQAVSVDISSPDMDGYESARQSRRRNAASRIYASSGSARHERHEDAASSFDGWIEKPADPDASSTASAAQGVRFQVSAQIFPVSRHEASAPSSNATSATAMSRQAPEGAEADASRQRTQRSASDSQHM